jgi:hypothetical protein
MTFPFTAMGMPQKEVFENRILAMKEGNKTYLILATVGVANLIQLTTGRVNECWMSSFAQRFSANQHPCKPITAVPATSIGRLAFYSGTTIPRQGRWRYLAIQFRR